MIALVLKFVTLATVIVGAIAVYTAIRNNSRQMAANIFLNYSDRVRVLGLRNMRRSPDAQTVLESIYIMFEFYELRRRGYVAWSIWSIWEADMSDLLSSPAYRKQWHLLRDRFANHPHFLAWVTRQQKGNLARDLDSAETDAWASADRFPAA
jgi:hypothetical protein